MNTLTACTPTCPRPTRGERMTLSLAHRIESIVAARVERRAQQLPVHAEREQRIAAAAADHDSTMTAIRTTILPR